MIEDKLTELIEALKENTAALKAQGTSTPAAAPATRTRAPKADKADKAEAPAKEEKPAEKTVKVTANDLKKFIKDERTRLKEVSDECFKAHKEASAKILKKYGLTDFTSIPDEKVEPMFTDFKAVNVEQPKDDLEDDDLNDDDDDLN